MKTRHLLQLTTLSLLSTLNLQLSTALAQGTAFTYQGRLNDGSGTANGVYDFTFQAFDAPTAGGSIGSTVNLNAVSVTNGLFTALVDLGSSPFTGPARWLQVSVRANGAGSFTTLVPRQALTSSPYAIFARTAGTVTNGAIASDQLAANSVATGNIQNNAVIAGKIASGQVVKSLNGLTDGVSLTQGANVTINTVGNSLQISAPAGGLNLPFSGTAASTGSIFTLSNSAAGPAGVFLGKVGIGTTNPQSLLNVNGTLLWGGTTTNYAYSGEDLLGVFFEQNGSSAARSAMRFQSSKSGDLANYSRFVIDPNNGFSFQTLGTGNGNVGLGTATPLARLDVRGDIRLGPSGQFRAMGGEENLRTIRGAVGSGGGIAAGSGFTPARISEGDYLITFNTPFAAAPTVTATVDDETEAFEIADFFVAGVFDPRPDSVRVRVRVHSGLGGTTGPLGRKFHFIAIGPR